LKHSDPTVRRRFSLRSATPDDIPLIAKMHAQGWAAIGFYETRGWQRAGREHDRMAGTDTTVLRYIFPLD
jgi:hypothetical protein